MSLKIGDYVMIAKNSRNRISDIVESRQNDYLKVCAEPFVVTKQVAAGIFQAEDPENSGSYIRLSESWFVKCDPPQPPADPNALMELLL